MSKDEIKAAVEQAIGERWAGERLDALIEQLAASVGVQASTDKGVTTLKAKK
jgi:hypothetical protein